MATLDSKPVTIQVDDAPVFVGQLKELAAPYLGLATAASVGMGVMTMTLLGWSQSSSKLSQTRDEVAKLQKELQDRDALVEQLKFSDTRLEASGLSDFIEDEPVSEVVYAPTQHQPYQVSTSAPMDRAIALSQAARRHPAKQAAAAMPSAQAMNGFVRAATKPSRQEAISATVTPSSEQDATQLNELLNNLKQVMAQVEKLHRADAGHNPLSSPAA
jgi:hypothetical protein